MLRLSAFAPLQPPPGVALRQLAKLTAVVLGLLPLFAQQASADEVFDWSVSGFDAAAAGGQNSVVISRTMAMMHLAVHDALNAIERRYESYLYDIDRPFKPQYPAGLADPAATANAAIAAAARDVLVGVIPDWGKPEQRTKALALVESAYTTALAKLPEGLSKKHGVAVGQSAAAAMIAARKTDGSSAPSHYTPGTAPGKWRPHPNPVPPNPLIPDPALAVGNWPPILPQWGQVAPFTMVAPWQYRLPGPPVLASPQYAQDYEEVKRLGGKNSTARTPEQSEIARYWYEGSPQGWSRIARLVAAQHALDLRGCSLSSTRRSLMASSPDLILWRPVTAIRAGDTDGNDATAADPTWETLLNTPPIPDYPSTHSVSGGAAAAVLTCFFGSDQIGFSMTSGAPFAGITRSFKSFSQASQENADSRVYAGIHFRTACRDGIKLGDQIGRRTFTHYLLPHRK